MEVEPQNPFAQEQEDKEEQPDQEDQGEQQDQEEESTPVNNP